MGRIDKYSKKIDGEIAKQRYDATKKLSVEQEGEALKKAVQIESRVKALLSDEKTMLIPYYIIFAKELEKIKNKHTAETAINEGEIIYNKWAGRGLEKLKLNKVAGLFLKKLVKEHVNVTGAITPDMTGLYFDSGTYNTKKFYMRTDGKYYIWYYGGTYKIWIISLGVGYPFEEAFERWYSGGIVQGDYDPKRGATGTATVSEPQY